MEKLTVIIYTAAYSTLFWSNVFMLVFNLWSISPTSAHRKLYWLVVLDLTLICIVVVIVFTITITITLSIQYNYYWISSAFTSAAGKGETIFFKNLCASTFCWFEFPEPDLRVVVFLWDRGCYGQIHSFFLCHVFLKGQWQYFSGHWKCFLFYTLEWHSSSGYCKCYFLFYTLAWQSYSLCT